MAFPPPPSRLAPDGAAIAGLPEVIGLLYRADWTRLSLSAGLRSDTDGEPLPRLSRDGRSRWSRAWPGQRQDDGRYVGRGALLIGPGGRWRLECRVPGGGAGDRPLRVMTASAAGRGGRWNRWLPAGPGRGGRCLSAAARVVLPVLPARRVHPGSAGAGDRRPPRRDRRRGHAAARRGQRSVPGHDRISHDRIEAAVDAELGILLRRTETSGGELVTLTELTDVTMNPPEAADLARFAPPPGSNRSESPAAGPPKWLTGPVGKNAVGLAAGGLGALIRYAPHRPGHGPGPPGPGGEDLDAAFEQAREQGDVTPLVQTVKRWWFEADAWRDPQAQREFLARIDTYRDEGPPPAEQRMSREEIRTQFGV